MHIHKEFFRYVIPSMLAFALSGIYAIADGFFVGNALGDNALAAINIAYPLTAFIQSIGTGIGMGGAIQYAICLGKQEHKRSSQYFGMAVLLLIVFSLGLTAILSLGGSSILRLFGASGEILKLGEEYIRFISYGALFQVLATGLVPFIRNMG
ncbi:MAG: MATE family efflux transporter, partial [Clostridium sp.]